MFLTLTNVQSGGAVSLLQYIDNRSGNVRVGLRSVTYTVGWYNVGARESISWRATLNNEIRQPPPPAPPQYPQGFMV